MEAEARANLHIGHLQSAEEIYGSINGNVGQPSLESTEGSEVNENFNTNLENLSLTTFKRFSRFQTCQNAFHCDHD